MPPRCISGTITAFAGSHIRLRKVEKNLQIYITSVTVIMYKSMEAVDMPKVRTQIYLTEEQHQMLSRLSNQGKIPIASIVRDAINDYLSKISSIENVNPLSSIIALGESGGSLGSLKHDEEIYGD